MEIKKEKKVESMFDDNDEKSSLPIKKKAGRPRNSAKLLNGNIDREAKQEMNTSIRRSTKRNLSMEKNTNDICQSQQGETSIDNISLSIRRSSRIQQVPFTKPVSSITSKTISTVWKNQIRMLVVDCALQLK